MMIIKIIIIIIIIIIIVMNKVPISTIRAQLDRLKETRARQFLQKL